MNAHMPDFSMKRSIAHRIWPSARRVLARGRTLAVAVVFLAACLALLPRFATAQPSHPPLTVPFRFPAVQHGSVDFGDADNDGELDVALIGETPNGPIITSFQLSDTTWSPCCELVYSTKVYRRMHMDARPVSHGSIRWGDYDGDGDDDLLVTGLADIEGVTRHQVPSLEIYENNGVNVVFGGNRSLSVRRMTLPGLYRSAAEWGDFDGDGDLDFAAAGLPSLDAAEPVTWIYRNDGGSFSRVPTDLQGVFSGALAWGDYDGDGDLDLALTGDRGGGFLVAHLYRTDGGQFTDSGIALPGLAFGSLDWGDYDRDGDLDLLMTGGRLDPRFLRGVTLVFRNDGGALVDGGFDLEGHALGEARWGDADRDGDLDIFVMGSSEALEAPVLRLYTFTGSRFVPTWDEGGMRFGAVAVGDYNGDGDADVVVTGERSVGGLGMRFIMNRDFFECVIPSWVPLGQPTGNC